LKFQSFHTIPLLEKQKQILPFFKAGQHFEEACGSPLLKNVLHNMVEDQLLELRAIDRHQSSTLLTLERDGLRLAGPMLSFTDRLIYGTQLSCEEKSYNLQVNPCQGPWLNLTCQSLEDEQSCSNLWHSLCCPPEFENASELFSKRHKGS
jgi:hypothetical protein